MAKADNSTGKAGDALIVAPRRGGRSAVRLRSGKAGQADVRPEPAAAQSPGQRRRGDAVRERILAAALECFGTFGFEGTSTRAVAEQAQVTHTLIIYHFESKEQLWIATLEHALEAYGSAMKTTLDKVKDQSAKIALSTFIDQFVRMSAQQPQIHRILTMQSTQDSDRLQWLIDHFIRDHFTLVCDMIRRGQAEGAVRQCDPARLYYHIIGAGGTPFTLATEYRQLTGRDVFSDAEILRTIAFIYEIVFA